MQETECPDDFDEDGSVEEIEEKWMRKKQMPRNNLYIYNFFVWELNFKRASMK